MFQNHSIWKIWSRVFAIWSISVSITAFGHELSEPRCQNLAEDSEALIRAARHYAGLQDYDQALACIDQGLAHHPQDLDLRFSKAHILAWQGQHTEALQSLNGVDLTTGPAYAMLGDLAYLASRFDEAASFYSKAIAAPATPPESLDELVQQKIKSLRASDERSRLNIPTGGPINSGFNDPASHPYVDSHPADTSRWLLGADAQRSTQSQQQSLTDLHIFGANGFGQFELFFDGHNIKRTFPDETLGDDQWGLGVSYTTSDREQFSLFYEHTSLPHFSYRDFYSVNWERPLGSEIRFGLGVQQRLYPETREWLGTAFGEYYKREYVFRLAGYWGAGGRGTAVLRASRSGSEVVPEIWVATGSDDPMRPYLANSTRENLISAGVKGTIKSSAGINPYAWYEYQRSKTFWQNTIGIGLIWIP